ncbi:MAG TPA: DUF3800 domain-containing protein [Candidatus Binatia bacterium]|nr:DUF3800 domain-containing protein [Candidatus Binatia bacterium]
MLLQPGGIDVWYVDESSDDRYVAVSAISVPFLRCGEDGQWRVVWGDEFKKVQAFRLSLRAKHGVPVRKELHALNLASGRGSYRGKGRPRFGKRAGAAVYLWALQNFDFLQFASIISVVAQRGKTLYGYGKLEGVMYALFQRMQRQSEVTRRAGFTFFDEGHAEFRKLYRRARIHLPTGSSQGGWPGGQLTMNKPMVNFVKDGNTQDSSHSLYVQIVDLIAYAALLRIRRRYGGLTPWQIRFGLDDAYDAIPIQVCNLNAARGEPRGVKFL